MDKKPKKDSKIDKTLMLKQSDVQHNWIELDAAGKTLGRLASEIAKILRGKNKPNWTPHIDNGDGVIVVNADKIVVSGNKEATKIYTYYTGHIGGLRQIPYRTMQARKPEYIITHAVKGMMPRTRQGRAQLKRLRVFAGTEHKHQAQQTIQANI